MSAWKKLVENFVNEGGKKGTLSVEAVASLLEYMDAFKKQFEASEYINTSGDEFKKGFAKGIVTAVNAFTKQIESEMEPVEGPDEESDEDTEDVEENSMGGMGGGSDQGESPEDEQEVT